MIDAAPTQSLADQPTIQYNNSVVNCLYIMCILSYDAVFNNSEIITVVKIKCIPPVSLICNINIFCNTGT